jgi:hypothetical protein
MVIWENSQSGGDFDWDNLASTIGVEGFEGCLFALDITVGL